MQNEDQLTEEWTQKNGVKPGDRVTITNAKGASYTGDITKLEWPIGHLEMPGNPDFVFSLLDAKIEKAKGQAPSQYLSHNVKRPSFLDVINGEPDKPYNSTFAKSKPDQKIQDEPPEQQTEPEKNPDKKQRKKRTGTNDEKIREVIKQVAAENLPAKEITRRIKISIATARRYIARMRETGEIHGASFSVQANGWRLRKNKDIQPDAFTKKNYIESRRIDPEPQKDKEEQEAIADNVPPQKDDAIHPKYYQGFTNGAKPIDICEHLSFNCGQVVKYVSRAGKKKESGMTDKEKAIEDLEKAKYYLEREIRRIDK